MLQIERVEIASAKTSQLFCLISAGLAFLAWGTWAYWVNAETPTEGRRSSPVLAGLTQGTGSFIITLIMVQAVTWLYHQMPGNSMKVVLPAMITFVASGIILATAHALVGTQNIIRTIVPALSMALLFNLYTANRLRLMEKKATVN